MYLYAHFWSTLYLFLGLLYTIILKCVTKSVKKAYKKEINDI